MTESPDLEAASLPGHQRNLVWRTFQFFIQNVCALWLQYRVRGIEKLPHGGALLIINHQSFIDPLLVGVGLQRPVSFLARDNLFRVPVIGWILKNTYVMPIRREAAGSESLRESLRRIGQGFLVGIFPEGTRTMDGSLGPLKPGFIALLRRSNCPVVPVGIAGAFEALPRGAKWLRRRPVRVVFGDSMTAEELHVLSARGNEESLMTTIARRMQSCAEEAEQWRKEARAAVGRG